MPVEYPLPRERMPKCPVEFMDTRLYFGDENLRLGFNGFAMLKFVQNRLEIDYIDLNGDIPFSEQWTVNDGTLTRTDHTAAPRQGA